jgi:hypothetical protein
MPKKFYARLLALLLATLSALLFVLFAASSLPFLYTWFDSLQVLHQTWALRAMWVLLGLSCLGAAYAGYSHQKQSRHQDNDVDKRLFDTTG